MMLRSLRGLLVLVLAATAACTSQRKPEAGSTETRSPAAGTSQTRAPERLPAADPDAKPFEESSLVIEINSTDGDAGFQPFVDHDSWKWVAMYMPDGSKLFDIVNRGPLEDYGLTELFSESSEPPFDEFPFAEFKKLWPEGTYTYLGETTDGKPLRSEVTLSHDVPEGPRILQPRKGLTFDGAVVIRWDPGRQPVKIRGYQVIVETEEGGLRVLSAELPADARSFSVPREFASPAKYKVEVLARAPNGNQTITEVPFKVA